MTSVLPLPPGLWARICSPSETTGIPSISSGISILLSVPDILVISTPPSVGA